MLKDLFALYHDAEDATNGMNCWTFVLRLKPLTVIAVSAHPHWYRALTLKTFYCITVLLALLALIVLVVLIASLIIVAMIPLYVLPMYKHYCNS